MSEPSLHNGDLHAVLTLKVEHLALEVLTHAGKESKRLTGRGTLSRSFSLLHESRVVLEATDQMLDGLPVSVDLWLATAMPPPEPIGRLSYLEGLDKGSGDLFLEGHLTEKQFSEICDHAAGLEVRFQFGGLHRDRMTQNLIWTRTRETALPITVCVTLRELASRDGDTSPANPPTALDAHLAGIAKQLDRLSDGLRWATGVGVGVLVALVANLLAAR